MSKNWGRKKMMEKFAKNGGMMEKLGKMGKIEKWKNG
jgi:hypothetical protein